MIITKSVDIMGTIRYMNEKGQFHREDGPAFEDISGYKSWCIKGESHREDGPAVINSDGDEYYYLNGKQYSREEWEVQVLKLKLKRILDL